MPESVEGLSELRRGLKQLGADLPKELQKTNKAAAELIADAARSNAASLGGVHARAAGAIKGYATGTSLAVGVSPTRGFPMANVAFWGALKHTGWYARGRYSSSPAQHPPWVGSSWQAGVAGEGPYAINDAVAENLDRVLDEWGESIDGLIRVGALRSIIP